MEWTFQLPLEGSDEVVVLCLANELFLDKTDKRLEFLSLVKHGLKKGGSSPSIQHAIAVVFDAVAGLCATDYSEVGYWAAVPCSRAYKRPPLQGFVENLARGLGAQAFSLERISTVESSRFYAGEKGTIDTRIDVQGKVVGIIDDYVTSGSTLEACRLFLKDKGASEVVMIGIGKLGVPEYPTPTQS
ncbi:hypothetical protein BASA81_001611 [Batrachochytrium salamandrivorans]|nr:hypothetical protein BASA81_001611 [Batrachochytrium salamandrivorans]